MWKRKTKNFVSKKVLPLFLCSDDYETGNALGSHSGVNKLAGTYITIPYFPPQFQSLLSIYHALLYYVKDRAEFGNFAVFRKLIEEFRFLETAGVNIELPQGETKILFKLGLVIGDNLGLHMLLGFVESFNANFACRFCTMNKLQRSQSSIEDQAYLRTKTQYDEHLHIGDMSQTGIKEECIFNRLPDFHVTENFAVDIMHDILEGICESDLIALIKYCTLEKKYFSFIELNSLLKSYDWGITDSGSIPPPILEKDLKKDEIRMSATQMHTFVRHFGVLVAKFVPEDDPVWQIYIILRQILGIVCSQSIQIEYTVLQNLIKEHNSLVRQLLKRTSKSKDHIVIHYPRMVAECCPLIKVWCMRLESKHRESKVCNSAPNSKQNVCYSIAKNIS